jgi:predicted ATP-grasp superfamily ATP-dependent carboligase
MSDELVTWDDAGVTAWEKSRPGGARVMVHSMRGFIDAGRTGQILSAHIVEESEPVRVATFDVDRLLDYRSRRPEMVFSVNAWTHYDEPFLQVDMVTDAAGTPFLLLHGFEPDVLWEAFVREVRSVADRLGVTLTLAAHGIPMAAPHTRPIGVTAHGTRPDLLPDVPNFFSTITVPGAASSLLEYRFGQWGLDAATVAVHVPHYLSQSSYPQAAVRAMESLETLGGLKLDPAALDEACATASEEIDRQVAESDEVQALVASLEEQYDAFLESREGVIPLGDNIPTADELGAEFEKFLADRGRDFPGSSGTSPR